MKTKWPHQNGAELSDLIDSKWKNHLSEAERLEFEKQAKELQ